MVFIDTHTHLFAEEFNEDIDLVIERAKQLNVQKMLLPNIDIESISAMKACAERFPNHCFPMIGIHPCSVNENYKKELEVIKAELESGYKYYGIGEIGMDLYWDKSTQQIQSEAFLTQCEWAVKHQLAVSIHTRSATYETIQLLKSIKQCPKGVFHCFSGSVEEGKEIIKLGFKLGIGGVITYKNSTLPETLKNFKPQDLVLETDSPYLPPTPHRGKRNESSYIPLIAQKVADTYEMNINEIAKITSENAQKLFYC
jgi:TatD DNase family protein